MAKKPMFTKQIAVKRPTAKGAAGKQGQQQEPPKIEFPCADYPIKVVGRGIPGYDALVIETVRRLCPDLDTTKVHAKESGKGTFRSVTLYITAQSEAHLGELHRELTALDCVQMVI